MTKNKRSILGLGVTVTASCLLLASITGCISFGRNFSMPVMGAIEVGKTTQPQTEQMFGPPWKRGLDDGYEAWSYFYARHHILWWATHTKELYIVFDRNLRVRRFSSSGNFPGQ